MLSAVINAGGDSTRMGMHKALLPMPPDGRSLLAHVVATAAAVAEGAIYVVANHPPVQDAARLLPNVTVLADDEVGLGPLAGIAAGLARVPAWTLVLACDMPLLRVELLRLLAVRCDPAWDAVVPVVDGRVEPLCAIYHRRCLPVVQEMLRRDNRRSRDLFGLVRTQTVAEADLRAVDPNLQSFTNVNTPQEWDEICRALRAR